MFQVRQCCTEMNVATDAVLKQGLEHQSPMYRYAAALAVGGRNKVEYEEQLLKLLCDTDTLVQQAARRSLIELSKKQGGVQDFGPLPGASAKQVDQATELWRDWWRKKQSKS